MDPNATLQEMFDAWRDDDFKTMAERAVDLQGWLLNGGFLPDARGDEALRRSTLICFVAIAGAYAIGRVAPAVAGND